MVVNRITVRGLCLYIALRSFDCKKGTGMFESVKSGVRLGVMKGLSEMTETKYGKRMCIRKVSSPFCGVELAPMVQVFYRPGGVPLD